MKPIVVTPGDPAGIGPEIVARAFAEAPEVMRGCFVVGNMAVMRRAAGFLPGLMLPVVELESVGEEPPPRSLPVLPAVDMAEPWIVPGRVDARAGAFAGQCVQWAARAALVGDVSAIVTAPLHKEALHAAGYPYPGHTELLQAEAAAHAGLAIEQMPVRMMLANAQLRTVLVSIHCSLREAIDAVRFEPVWQTVQITRNALTRLLGREPRIALAGLNPHAGEGGLMGREEIEVLEPVVRAAQDQGWAVTGPLAPDTVFMRARKGEFDVVVAMYHDQGLIPVKYLGVDEGVNVTLGLPVVSTCPDHGTAFDIAGRGIASPASLIQAVRMAKTLVSA
ncbi:MAG TPA: 4-hydroxythreonine-4-phosphate dehydrogenase PdxA [Burkholderiaceae bacterium]|nr:4-hydroxythreonine-4-phosphate dehydrogenase PdxA [Burkholderiaceae bacterium]